MVFRGPGAHEIRAKAGVHFEEEKTLVSLEVSKDSVTFCASKLALFFLVCHI